MSLKAKLEAVVYAAEEPVSLAQFAAIFAEEVRQRLDDQAGHEPEHEEPEQIALVGLSSPMVEDAPTVEDAPDTPVMEDAPAAGAAGTAEPEAGADDEKKSARLRERRVRQVLQAVLDELIADYANSERGMEIREIAGGYRMATKPEYHDAVRGFVKSLKPPMKLSLQALETLAVIAYKQPVTAPEVSEIRGVDSGGVLGGLVSRKLITTAGRKPVIGRPILYKTTKEFLLRFGLKDVNDLPSMEEFEKMAGELAEAEAQGEAQDVGLQSSEAMHSAESGGEPPAGPGEEEAQQESQEEMQAELQGEAEEPSPAVESAGESTAEDHELSSNGVKGQS